jgi:hypothetical protein
MPHDFVPPLELNEVRGNGREHRRKTLQDLKVGSRLIGRRAEEDDDLGSTSVDLDSSRGDGDGYLRCLQAFELCVGNGDPGIDEEVILAALARQGRLDFGAPRGEGRSPEELFENPGKGAASIEQDSLGAQELVDHERTGLSLAPLGMVFEYPRVRGNNHE